MKNIMKLIQNESNEFVQAQKLIEEDYEDHFKFIKKIKNKNEKHITHCLNEFLDKLIKKNFVLLPNCVIYNPLIHNLTNLILLSNTIKTMLKLSNNDYKLEYDNILSKYNNNTTIMNEAERYNCICFEELKLLKRIVSSKYNDKQLETKLLVISSKFGNKAELGNQLVKTNR